MSDNLLTVKRIKNTLVLQQEQENGWFVTSDKVIVVDIDTLASIIKFLVKKDYLSKKVLEGILSELKE